MASRIVPLLMVLVLTACQSNDAEKGDVAEGPAPAVAPPAPGDLPAGKLQKTSRDMKLEALLPDLAHADLVYLGGDRRSVDHRKLQLVVLDQLFERGRLHAIGTEYFDRSLQKSLDDFTFGRIDLAELAERSSLDLAALKPVLDFARSKRLPMLALGVESELREKVEEVGFEGLSSAARAALPPLPSEDSAHRERWREIFRAHSIGGSFDAFYLGQRVAEEVAADVVVRWYREAAPKNSQIVLLMDTERVAYRDGLPARIKARIGKRRISLLTVPVGPDGAPARSHSREFADYVWLSPAP